MPQQAAENTQKGDVVFEQVPTVFVQTRKSRKRCLVCGYCGKQCGSASQQLSIARKQTRRAAVERPQYTLPDLPSATSSASCCLCTEKGCDEVFCGEACREAACSRGAHMALCCSGSNAKELHCLAAESEEGLGEAILLAASLIARTAKVCHSTDAAKLSNVPDLKILEELLRGAPVDAAVEDGDASSIDDNVKESRLLLSLVLVHDVCWLDKTFAGGSDGSVGPGDLRPLREALTDKGFSALVSQLRKVAIRLDMASPLVQYCHDLLKAPSEMVAAALKSFQPFVEKAFADDGVKHTSEISASFLERTAARLAQAGEAAMWGGENPFADSGGCLMALTHAMEHSCVPNAILEVAERADSICVRLRAFRDIRQGEAITLSYTSVDAPLAERDVALKKRFGDKFICDCIRCRSDHWGAGDAGLSSEQLRELAEQAAFNAIHDETFKLYGEILKMLPHDGDALHCRGVARYESGRWREGNDLFEEGYKLNPDHHRLKEEVHKIEAYRRLFSIPVIDYKQPPFESYLDNTAFLTSGPVPILSPAECQTAIAAAEAFSSAQGGWTTVRHYAVPTTDLNIHEVPALLEMFLPVFRQRLAPLLAAQFGADIMGEGGANIRIGDAFLVKYTLDSGSKHIPVHKDYSTHSFSIALNSTEEYGGGGTYFCKLGRVLNPEKGHVVSFSGDLAHGGDPITHGVRYILAVFMYTDGEDDDSCLMQGSAKRQKTVKVDHDRLKPMLKGKTLAGPDMLEVRETATIAEEAEDDGGGASWLLSLGE